jgi:ribosomal protein S18 acetylase RimI-like enzyme
VDRALKEAAAAGAQCLYLFIDADDLAGIEAAVRMGGRLVDLRVELEGRVEDETAATGAPTRRAIRTDHEELLRQTRRLAGESRFARDPRIPDDRVREMYEIWLDRCLAEGVVVVPSGDGRGFVGARQDGDLAHIELVYVDAASRGQGLGRALVRGAMRSMSATMARVVTQTGNVGAQRLYQSLGLRSHGTLAVLHFWLDERDG